MIYVERMTFSHPKSRKKCEKSFWSTSVWEMHSWVILWSHTTAPAIYKRAYILPPKRAGHTPITNSKSQLLSAILRTCGMHFFAIFQITHCVPKLTHCTPNMTHIVPPTKIWGYNPKIRKKKFRKSPDFRPDFPSIGEIVPPFLLDNPGIKKSYVVQMYMVQFSPLSSNIPTRATLF